MGKTKAILTGVSEYPTLNAASLPLCKNDIVEMKKALVSGLNVEETDILTCGQDGYVTKSDLISSINAFLKNASKDDILIFYFSGHGSKTSLALSDGVVGLQNLIDIIEKLPIKCKIVILDSCHSGSAELNSIPEMDINGTVALFAGYGYAVMASCSNEQTSGFDTTRKMSLYTRFVCDALTSRFLIREGKKSLEAINQAIFRFAEIHNNSLTSGKQTPIFRSSIGGTIFFDVDEYKPYKANEIHQETDNYIIYSVVPLKSLKAKQLKVNVILRFKSTLNQIAEYSKKICKDLLYTDIYANATCEAHHKGNPCNIITCHFGYDEMDMVNESYVCHTVWVDNTQNKDIWYRTSKNTEWVNGIFVWKNNSYNALKLLQKESMSDEELITTTKNYTANIVNASEKVIKHFREYLNEVITEEELIDILPPLNADIYKWFIKQSNLPLPSAKLKKWAAANEALSCAAVDFSLYYDKQNLSKWNCENRKQLMLSAMHKYEEALEEVKSINIEFQ